MCSTHSEPAVNVLLTLRPSNPPPRPGATAHGLLRPCVAPLGVLPGAPVRASGAPIKRAQLSRPFFVHMSGPSVLPGHLVLEAGHGSVNARGGTVWCKPGQAARRVQVSPKSGTFTEVLIHLGSTWSGKCMRRGLSGNIHEVSSLAPFDSIVYL